MSKEIQPIIAKSNKPLITPYGEITPTELFSSMIHNPHETGWFFPTGDPEFWKFSDKLLVPGGKALDLGVGDGRTSLPFALRGMPVIGYEIDPNNLILIRAMQKEYDLPIDIREQNILEADLGKEQYDTVILGQTFNHFPNKEQALKVLENSIDAMKPGGHIWLRAGGKNSSAFEDLHYYSLDYPQEVKKVDNDVYLAPCNCSGERKIEPQLFFDPLELPFFMSSKGLKIVHAQIISEEGKMNIMYGEDWNRSQEPPRLGGMITLIARK